MEQLDFLIRTLTYKRSCLELDRDKRVDKMDSLSIHLQGKIDGLQFAITEIYKLVGEMANEKQKELIEINDLPKTFDK